MILYQLLNYISKKSILLLILISIILLWAGVNTVNSEELPSDNIPIPEGLPESDTSNEDNLESIKSKNINLDMWVLYGQYKQMLSTINLSQQGKRFVYLLSSDFSKSGDFGYEDETYVNSDFNENRFALTVNWNVSDNLKIIPEVEVDNDSRGMYDNEIYSREEKGKDKVSCKVIYKWQPALETYIDTGGAWYTHRLIALDPSDHSKSRLYQGDIKAGGEYIWSASNRIKLNMELLHYDYSQLGAQNDNHKAVELLDDFNITHNIGIGIGLGYAVNDDAENKNYPFPRVSLSLKGLKNFSFLFLYRYDITPFRPEDFYLEQDFIQPVYDLRPGEVNHGEIRADYRMNSMISIKWNLTAEKNDNFYNYYTVYGDVLSTDTMKVVDYSAKMNVSFFLYEKIIEFDLGYEYAYFDAEKHVTYHPDHSGLTSIIYNGKKWKFEWNNEFRGNIYTDPENNDEIPGYIIGDMGVQRKVLDGSYFYVKIENLYNNRYNMRKGYPEPGISFLGGLRILI